MSISILILINMELKINNKFLYEIDKNDPFSRPKSDKCSIP